MKRLALLLVLAGCRGLLGIDESKFDDGGIVDDGGIDDAARDAPEGVACFGSFLKVCLPALPSSPLTLTGSLNTSTDPRCIAVAGTDACVIAATTIDVSGTVDVTGARPLILVATSGPITIVTAATLDAASHHSGKIGPGADLAACGGSTNPTGLGGGYGGSFIGQGGTGGNGNGGAAGQAGGSAAPTVMLTALRGGCAGWRPSGGLGEGAGGGAVGMVSAMSITVNGVINASGAGGTRDPVGKGGGGGGSGGAIVLEAPSVVITGNVLAQGGGGAEGGDLSTVGLPGQDPSPTSPGAAAPGGSGNSTAGGNGGSGGTSGGNANGKDGGNGGNNGGGGGGGGGTGIIRAIGTVTNNGKVSPPPT